MTMLTQVCTREQPDSTDILRELLRRDPVTDYADSDGRTALIWAASAGCTEAVQVLLEAGAKPDLPDNEGLTGSNARCTTAVVLL